MTNEQSQNEKDLKKEKSKILVFLKENILIVVFFIVNLLVSLGLFFVVGMQEGLLKNATKTIEEYIISINNAAGKVETLKGRKISLFNDKKKIDNYEKALNKFIQMFGKSNLKVKISPKIMGINKYYLNNNPDLKKIKEYVYWGVSNGIKIQVASYPIKSKKLSILILK